MVIPVRRFGRTELNMPVLSLGGMRFQKSWKQLDSSEISDNDQNKVENIFKLADNYGFNHIETARHYGTSEIQIGLALNHASKGSKIIQTKIPPNDDVKVFEDELKVSFDCLGLKKIDLLSLHGINESNHLKNSLKDGGCIDVLKKWQSKKLIGHIGFSTHGQLSLIEQAISSNRFDYVNLHWYFINQNNYSAIKLAKRYDMGVFIISPTDKGGHLHSPSNKLLRLCEPLHPIVFNDLFCLRNQNVHTISVGIAKEDDFNHHLEAVRLLSQGEKYVDQIINNLNQELLNCLGSNWCNNWQKNLPSWFETPGKINIPVLLWLSNLLIAWDLEEFVKARYQLLGNGGHWFPGNNANALDQTISEDELLVALKRCEFKRQIIDKLRSLKHKFGSGIKNRLSDN